MKIGIPALLQVFPGGMTDLCHIGVLGYACHVWPEPNLSGCQHAGLASDVLLLKPCLWELTCLTSDAALGTHLVWIFAVPEGLVPG